MNIVKSTNPINPYMIPGTGGADKDGETNKALSMDRDISSELSKIGKSTRGRNRKTHYNLLTRQVWDTLLTGRLPFEDGSSLRITVRDYIELNKILWRHIDGDQDVARKLLGSVYSDKFKADHAPGADIDQVQDKLKTLVKRTRKVVDSYEVTTSQDPTQDHDSNTSNTIDVTPVEADGYEVEDTSTD